jgi:hypothetical protein
VEQSVHARLNTLAHSDGLIGSDFGGRQLLKPVSTLINIPANQVGTDICAILYAYVK